MTQTQRLGKKATTVHASGRHTVVTLYQTPVVEYTPKRVKLRSGGWKTQTTKVRMNQASNQFGLGYYVFQKKHDWFVKTPRGRTVRFKEGMVIKR